MCSIPRPPPIPVEATKNKPKTNKQSRLNVDCAPDFLDTPPPRSMCEISRFFFCLVFTNLRRRLGIDSNKISVVKVGNTDR